MDDKRVIVSAPGKIILTGEHAVVFGKKGLATSLNLRTYLNISTRNDDKISLELPDIGVSVSWKLDDICEKFLPTENYEKPTAPNEEAIRQLKCLANADKNVEDIKSLAIVAFLFLYGNILYPNCDKQLRPVSVHVSSWLPPGAGLGSSAAYATCLSAALLAYANCISHQSCQSGSTVAGWTPKELELINGWAFQVEKLVHGRPSGIDNTVSSYGGVLGFCSGVFTPIENLPSVEVLLVNTRIPRSTKALVAGVKEKHDKYPTVIGPVLDAIDAISTQTILLLTDIAQSVSSEDCYNALKDLINMNQRLLALLGVSHVTLDQIVSLADKHGLQAKLTGAGGGGCAFVLITPDTPATVVDRLKTELQQLGFDCWRTTAGGIGVVQHLALDGDSLFIPPPSFHVDS